MVNFLVRLQALAGVLIGLIDSADTATPRVRPSRRRPRPALWIGACASYRAKQKRRAAQREGNLADYAWYGSARDWERAKALALAGREDLICEHENIPPPQV
jgi:hypothetical protein